MKQTVVSHFELRNIDSFWSRCTKKHDKNDMWEYKAAHEIQNQWIYSRFPLNWMKFSRIHFMVFKWLISFYVSLYLLVKITFLGKVLCSWRFILKHFSAYFRIEMTDLNRSFLLIRWQMVDALLKGIELFNNTIKSYWPYAAHMLSKF